MPGSGHCSNAATNASCARSSATPTSRTMRTKPAMSRGDSILHTASMVRWVSVELTATHHTTFNPPLQPGLHAGSRWLGFTRSHFDETGCRLLDVSRKIGHLLHLPNLNGAIVARAPLSPFDRFLPRFHLDHPISAHNLLGLGKWPICNFRFAAGKRDPHARGGRMQSVERQQHAGLLQLLVILHHRRHRFRARHSPRFSLLISLGDHQHHESHRLCLLRSEFLTLLERRTTKKEIDTPKTFPKERHSK